jgi:hypothetical protein
MAETAYFVNSRDLFEAIQLGDCEQDEFLDQFTYGGNDTSLTLIQKQTFFNRLVKFIVDCEDVYEKDEMMQNLKEYNFGLQDCIKYVNIEN